MRILCIILGLLYISVSAMAQPPCNSEDCCIDGCGDDFNCICECVFAKGKQLLAQDSLTDAVKRFQYLMQACPERKDSALVLFNFVLENHRIWVYEGGTNGKFAIANPLGELIEGDNKGNPYRFTNPEPFRKGVAIFSEGNKYFLVNKEGQVLKSPYVPAYDGIIPTEGGLYYLIKEGWGLMGQKGDEHSFTGGENIGPVYWFGFFNFEEDFPATLEQIGPWGSPAALKIFSETVKGRYDKIDLLVGNFLKTKKGESFGLIDQTGKEILSPNYKEIEPIGEGEFKVKKEKVGVVDSTGREVIPLDYDELYCCSGGMIFVEKNRLFGLFDRTGQEEFSTSYEGIYPLIKGRAIIWKGEFSTIIDSTGKQVIPTIYDEIEKEVVKGNIWVKKKDKWGVIDFFGNILIPLDYQDKGVITDKNMWIKRNGKWGLIDYSDSIIVFPKYDTIIEVVKYQLPDNVVEYNPGRKETIPEAHRIVADETIVSVNKYWGIINRSGHEVIPSIFEDIKDIREGKVWVKKNGQWNLFDISTKKMISSSYDDTKEMVNYQSYKINNSRRSRVRTGVKIWTGYSKVMKKGAYGIVDILGHEIVPTEYEAIENINGNFVKVQREHCWGVWSLSGKNIIPVNYEEIVFLKGGKFRVNKDGGSWMVLDSLGREIEPEYPKVFPFGWKVIKNDKGGAIGFKDYKGRIFIPRRYEIVSDFQEGSARVLDSLWGLIDGMGRDIVPPKYIEVSSFKEGRAWVKPDTLWELINLEGEHLTDPFYREVRNFSEGKAWVKSDSLWQLIDFQGGSLIIPSFMEVRDFHESYAWVKRDTLWELINSEGSSLMKPKYKNVKDFYKGQAWVKKDSLWGLIDLKGQELFPPTYKELGDFYENKAWAKKDNYTSYIDRSGEIVFSHRLKEALGFLRGKALAINENNNYITIDSLGNIKEFGERGIHNIPLVCNENEWNLWVFNQEGKSGFVNIEGKEITPVNFNSLDFYRILFLLDPSLSFARFSAFPLKSNWILLSQGEKQGLLSVEESAYISTIYEAIFPHPDEKKWILVRKDGKWGWVDYWGRIQIPCRYDVATPFNSEGWAMVVHFGLQFRINRKGEMIWETSLSPQN